ncbi:MAG: hypothetical protein KGL39_13765 [Patescibacteria group bacterium]|nr:hypothetical protein [Patescibacteria group bacterium]
MNDNAKAWVAALRSGKYTQGPALRRKVRGKESFQHNCFGVACELAVEAGVIERWGGTRGTWYGGDGKLPPWKVVDWLGMSSKSGRYMENEHPLFYWHA